MGKTCCVTGHRKYPPERESWIREQLHEEIQKAVSDGFTTFISGFADGVDLIFAEIILEYRANGVPIFLEAAIPYANWLRSANPKFKALIGQTNGTKIVSENYFYDCYLVRNRYMIEQAQRLIAVYDPDRPKSGTGNTMRYAHALEVETVVIEL